MGGIRVFWHDSTLPCHSGCQRNGVYCGNLCLARQCSTWRLIQWHCSHLHGFLYTVRLQVPPLSLLWTAGERNELFCPRNSHYSESLPKAAEKYVCSGIGFVPVPAWQQDKALCWFWYPVSCFTEIIALRVSLQYAESAIEQRVGDCFLLSFFLLGLFTSNCSSAIILCHSWSFMKYCPLSSNKCSCISAVVFPFLLCSSLQLWLTLSALSGYGASLHFFLEPKHPGLTPLYVAFSAMSAVSILVYSFVALAAHLPLQADEVRAEVHRHYTALVEGMFDTSYAAKKKMEDFRYSGAEANKYWSCCEVFFFCFFFPSRRACLRRIEPR